jgi:hypothetical protein
MLAKPHTTLRSSPRKRGSRADIFRLCDLALDSRSRGNERSMLVRVHTMAGAH